MFPEAWLHRTIEAATGCRAYPAYVPKNATVPFVFFVRSATTRDRHLIAQAAVPVATFDVAVYADSYLKAKELASAIRLAADNFSRAMEDVTIHHSYLTAEADGEPEFFQGEDVPTYSVSMTFEVRFSERV